MRGGNAVDGYDEAEPFDPAPERITLVGAVAGQAVVMLTVRSWPRDDVEVSMERIVSSSRSRRLSAATSGLDLDEVQSQEGTSDE